MAEIRLEHVTVRYHRYPLQGPPSAGLVRRGYQGYQDRAFVERVVAQSDVPSTEARVITALDDVSLTIHDGETLAVIGPSGCGKSTLLRVIAGLEIPETGRVLYDDRDMENVKPGDRGIGMVFQSYALYPHLKGEGNLGFFFRIHKRPTEEMMERIRITSEIMGLGFDDLLSRRPKTLSGGQQQRLAIGRCIVRDPALFLFDEPLSNLDAKLRAATRVEIKRLLHRFGITAVYVTHDQTEAIALGDRLAVMQEGRIEQIGSYQELRERPRSVFVAGFVGTPPMNLIEGYRFESGGTITGPAGQVAVPEGIRLDLGPERRLTLGFRGTEARLACDGLDDAEPAGLSLAGAVHSRELDLARHEQTAYLESGGQLLSITLAADPPLLPGKWMQVRLPFESLYLFDSLSGQRLYP